MKLLITGAAGFVGRATARLAHERGHAVIALVRRDSDRIRLPFLDSRQIIVGNILAPEAFAEPLRGIEAIIHAAAVTSECRPNPELSHQVNVEGVRRLYEAARASGVGRWVQISSMSAHAGSTSVYGSSKFKGDELLRSRQSAGWPAWTILKPSLIYGPDERGLVAKTLALARRLPVLPIIGNGMTLIRPIHVDDVAGAALDCLESEKTIYRTLMIGGRDEVTLNFFMENLCKKFNLNRRLFHLPLPMCHFIAIILARFNEYPPITIDNVLGVREVPMVEIEQAIETFGFNPRTLESGLTLIRSDLGNSNR